MENNVYKFSKKMKILAGIAIPLGMLTMILFLTAVLINKSNVFVYVTLFLFVAAVCFELYVLGYCLKIWYGKYKEKYRGL